MDRAIPGMTPVRGIKGADPVPPGALFYSGITGAIGEWGEDNYFFSGKAFPVEAFKYINEQLPLFVFIRTIN
jgi:hypothetical protein